MAERNIPERIKRRTALRQQGIRTLESLQERNRELEQPSDVRNHDVIVENRRRAAEGKLHRNIEQKNLVEAYNFNEKATKIALGNFIVKLTENSLLLDTEELTQKNPDWNKELYETVMSLVENGDLVYDLNPEMTPVLESIGKVIPNANIGILLTEDELGDVFNTEFNNDQRNTIDKLTKNVQNRVVGIINRDKKVSTELQGELDRVSQKYDELRAIENPALGQVTMEGLMTPKAINKPKVFREPIFTESNKKSLLETLAVNKGLDMIKEGKQYDGDVALADAMITITILESFAEVGLLNINEKTYADLIRK